MIVFGVILMLCGGVAVLWAHSTQNSFEYKWYEMFGSSDYEYVDVIFYIGIFVLIIGFILLIVGCSKRNSKTDKSDYISSDAHNNTDINTPFNNITCKQCGALIDKSMSFCPNCGSKNNTNTSKKKFCSNCGLQANENESFCGNCGCKF